MICKWVDLYLGWCIPCWQNLLCEGFSQPLDLDYSELLATDADDALEASGRAEGAGLLERIIAHWGHAVLVHVGIAQVWFRAESKDSFLTLKRDLGEAYFFKANEFGATVGQPTCDVVHHCPQQDSIFQPDVQI